MPTAEQASEAAWLQQAIADHEAALPEKETQAAAGRSGRRRGSPTLPEASPTDGLLAQYGFDGNLADPRDTARDGAHRQREPTFAAGRPGQSVAFNGEAQIEFPGFQAERFAVAFWMRSGALGEMTVLEGGPGFDIGIEDSHPQPDVQTRVSAVCGVSGPPLAQRPHRVRRAVASRRAELSRMRSRRCCWMASPSAWTPSVTAAAHSGRSTLAIGDPHRDKPLKGDVGGLRIYDRAAAPNRTPRRWRCTSPSATSWRRTRASAPRIRTQRLRDYFLTYDAPADLRRVYAKLKALKARAVATEERDRDRAGDGGDGQAARHLRSGARRLSQSRRRKSRRACRRMLPPLPSGRTGEPAGPGRVAGRPSASADRARGGEPLLADRISASGW